MTPALQKKVVLGWIATCALLVYMMVFVGGMTRLTDSGLSMVEWRPIVGTLPPTNTSEWDRVFNLYKATPEYKKVNHHFSLDEFKAIFYWEYSHRLLGRIIGLIFFLPLLFFQLKGWLKHFERKAPLLLWGGFLLGGSQGLLGWFMVKSGLVNRPDVSHYRLASHLLLALFILSYLYWLHMKFSQAQKQESIPLKKPLFIFLILVSLQITYGAFMAGLKAGFGFNEFPLMAGKIIPDHFFYLQPYWINFFENNVAIQFIHRSLGWSLLLLSLFIFFRSRKLKISNRTKLSITLLLIAILLQFSLGVLTLINMVPLHLAITHQVGAVLVLIAGLTSYHSVKA